MSNKRPPDLSKNEVRHISATLKQRYGHDIDVQLASGFPVVFWSAANLLHREKTLRQYIRLHRKTTEITAGLRRQRTETF
jgi:hypothetical protein